MDTVTTGRAKRSTAGNRMKELLLKAQQEDEDELFREVEDDEEFDAPQDVKDVFLDEFADTDEEVELDEEELERQMRREERRKAKGKAKAIHNPLAKPTSKPILSSTPSIPAPAALIAAGIDPSTMAPSTLVLALRKQRREEKRLARSDVRRSNLRASTLATEEAVRQREEEERAARRESRKGRKAQHEGGEVRGVRHLTQDELIAAALEEEERNKEALKDWLKKEEEKRELRRVGRKRVRGPRWTWVSRTVGRLVEEVEAPVLEMEPGGAFEDDAEFEQRSKENVAATASATQVVDDVETPTPGPSTLPTPGASSLPTPAPAETLPTPTRESPPPQLPDTTTATTIPNDAPAPYTRNYLILSQIPGGLPAELQVILGAHVEWDTMRYIPARLRPLNRRLVMCPLTGLPARYRHPRTGVPFATKEGYAVIEAVSAGRYVWGAGWGRREGDEPSRSAWAGGEGDVHAEGTEGIEGWAEAAGVERVWAEPAMQVQVGEVEVDEGVGVVEEEEAEADGAEVKEEEAEAAGNKGKGKGKGRASLGASKKRKSEVGGDGRDTPKAKKKR